ncbi:MAG: flagellar basal body rod C-terminal domain-containing protein, partial [candidate division Zixibacteria bacterium]|nr:flagellar basal body rod C-terminal domain-containing protein [candidate division Zixibacteria bacterium]
YKNRLNELARSLVTEVNRLHQSGYGEDGTTGIAFFDPAYTDASTIRLNTFVQDDINKIVSSAGVDGDNLIALAIADLRNTKVMSSGTKTLNEFYNSLVGSLGIEVKEATSFSGNYELLINQIDNSRQSVQGVSLDEEMANLIKSQHAYDAAARVITAMDEALDTVIYGMGIVGRS